MNRYSVASVGIPASDRLLLSKFIDLANLELGAKFVLDEAEDAHVVFANPLTAKGKDYLESGARHKVRIRYGDAAADNRNEHWLATPIQLPALRVLLTTIVGKIGPPSRSLNSLAGATANRRLERVIDALQKCDMSSGMGSGSLTFSGMDSLRIKYLSDTKKFMILVAAGRWEDALIKSIGSLSVESAIEAPPWPRAQFLSRNQFAWRVGLVLSEGLLLPAIANRISYALSSWPDFGHLGTDPGMMKAAALLTRRSATIAQIVQASGMPREQAIAFINACALIRCLHATPENLLDSGLTQTHMLHARHQEVVAHVNVPAKSAPIVKPFFGLLAKLRAALSFTAPNP